jgi:hypothetical protein
MKVKTNLRGGMTDQECYAVRDYWKNQAALMEQYANSPSGSAKPAGLYVSPYPPKGYSGSWGCTSVSNAPLTIDQWATPPSSGTGTGGSTGTIPPTTSGGGYVNGVYYPDYSGYCV